MDWLSLSHMFSHHKGEPWLIMVLRLKEIFPNKKKGGGEERKRGGEERGREREGREWVGREGEQGRGREERKEEGGREEGKICVLTPPLLKMHKFRSQEFIWPLFSGSKYTKVEAQVWDYNSLS